MVNRLRLQVFVAIVGLIAIGFSLAYFLLVVTPVNEPAPGGTYTEGVVIDTSSTIKINPLVAPANSFSQDVTALVFSGLTRSTPGTTADQPGQVITPDLADSWTVSADGKSWEFHLRKDIVWQDGVPFTSRDVAFTLGLLKSDDFQGPKDQAAVWRKVEVARLGDYTLRFQLEQPFPAFLSYTTLGILPAHKLENKIKAADLTSSQLEFNQAPVGIGPYQLAPGGITPDGVTLITNPLYKGKKPYLDKIWFRFYPSSNAALSAMQANQVDGVSEVSANEAGRLASLKNINEISTPRSRNTFLFLNLQRSALFSQKEVRQALAYAINKQNLVEKALNGQAVVSSSPILATSWAYNKDINPYTFDLQKANKLLDDAGWKINRDGIRERNNQRLVFRMLIDDTADKRAAASQIAENLKAIQVVAQVETAPSPSDLDTSLKSSGYDATLLTIESVLNDPDPFGNWHSSFTEPGGQHTNFANWKLDRADQLLEQARAVVKEDERKKLYLQWQQVWADELPSIPLYYSTYKYVVSNRVGGVQGQNLKVLNVASDRLKDITSRYIFTSTRFGA
ncbi:MAG: hypothetical protein JWP00_1307 [Chloroflexi bacterium]|nr:hypothetical protein [Chloroflexota bacterium]